MILPPRKMTFRRWWRLVSRPGQTLLRNLEYELIEGTRLEGLTLDVGGGEKTGYYNLLSIQGRIQSVNIDMKIVPTFLADLNQSIPVTANTYDNLIAFNTLEHIWRDTFVLREMFRVLKPGGSLYILVPFLYRVHASPSDYHRHTPFFWQGSLVEVGFARDNIQIEPIVFGPFAAPLSMVEFRYSSFVRRFLRASILAVPILKAWLRVRLRPRSSTVDDGNDLPLGYLIKARK